MAAKKKLLLAHRLFSAMLSHLLLLRARRPTTTTARSPPVVVHGAPHPSAALVPRRPRGRHRRRAAPERRPVPLLHARGAGGRRPPARPAPSPSPPTPPLPRRLGRGAGVRAMAAVAFCGLRATRFRAGRAVLPRWLAEDVAAVRAAGRRAVCVSAMPRVMVDAFLGEYLGVDGDRVVAREMNVVWGFYTGVMRDDDDSTIEAVVAAAAEPLFAELSDDVVPVAVAVETSMFYATTAGGLKCLDPLYYMANPRMCYTVQFLDKIDTSAVRGGGAPSTGVANLVQRRMGDALGYGCTMLTRKDKYLMLAGNDGSVRSIHGNSTSATTSAAGNDDTVVTGRKNKSSTTDIKEHWAGTGVVNITFFLF